MKKALSISVLGILIMGFGGCAGTAHFPRMYLMPQVGVILTVINNCAPFLDGSSPTHGDLFKGLPYGEPITLPLSSTAFSGQNRQIQVFVQGYTQNGTYLGSYTRTFSVDTYSGTRGEVWEVESIRANNNPGGCGVGVQPQVGRQD